MEKNNEKKRKGFLEKWAGAEESKTYLGITVWGLGALCGVMLFVLLGVVTKPSPIYYIPGAKEAGIAYPNRLEKGSVIGFAESWILSWSNFTPVTIEDVYARALQYMSPQLLSKTRAVKEKVIGRVKRDCLSSIFTVIDEPEVEEDTHGYLVTFLGKKAIYIGKENMKMQNIRYKVYLKKVPPTDSNYYGMVVADVKQEEILEQ